MTGRDIVQRREAIGLSREDLATRLHEHPDQLHAWEGIQGTIPRSLARRLDWTLALAEREAAIQAAGIPTCPVVAGLTSRPQPERSPESLKALYAQLEAHAATCPICRRRQAVWEAQPPLPPPPLPPLVAALSQIQAQAERLPAYLRPAIWGGLGFGALTLFRAAILLGVSQGAGLSQAGLAVVVAIGLGAYGGTAWGVTSHFARPAFSRYGRVGDYLTGLAVAAGTGLAFAAPAAALDLDPFFRTALGWGLLAIGVVLIGLVLGHRVFRSPVAPPGA